MSTDYLNFQARRPRHQATDLETPVKVRYAAATEWGPPCVLKDLSRNGICFLSSHEFPNGDHLEIEVVTGRPELQRSVAGIIRWRSRKGTQWQIAAELATPIDWEVLGELMLCGALGK